LEFLYSDQLAFFVLKCPFFFLLLIRCPPGFTLFPYTTLFRSLRQRPHSPISREIDGSEFLLNIVVIPVKVGNPRRIGELKELHRSEEHTSELQSQSKLV